MPALKSLSARFSSHSWERTNENVLGTKRQFLMKETASEQHSSLNSFSN